MPALPGDGPGVWVESGSAGSDAPKSHIEVISDRLIDMHFISMTV